MSMEKKFRFKLNLFDGIVLAIGLVAVVILGSIMLKPGDDPEVNTSVSTIRYTVCLEAALAGTGDYVKPGDTVYDSIKNYNLGTVESVEVGPGLVKTLDEETKSIVFAETEGLENVYITVVANATLGDNAVVLDGGYNLRVNAVAYIRGEGYVGFGPVVYIERGEQ